MRFTKLLLICMCCLITASAAWGQAANIKAKPGILGYLDPQTGAFRPLPQASEDDAELSRAVTTFTGTVDVTITVTLKTTTITNVTCEISTSTTDLTASPTFYEETNSVTATGSGATRTCKLSIPYSWSLGAQTADSMTTSYVVIGGTSATAPTTRTATRNPLDTRKVPANGATTTLTAAVTL
jgi:hypothetical protein